jgi:EF-P lysine aminoacylase GenX
MDNFVNYPAGTRRNSSVARAVNLFGEKAAREAADNIWIAGRIIGILDDGFVLQDESGRTDLVFKGEINIGDIAEVKISGETKARENGQTYVQFSAEEMAVLAPCKEEFFIGRDAANSKKIVIDLNLKEKFLQRQKLTQKIRDFFIARGFNEVETPSLVALPGMEPHLEVFKTGFKSLDGQAESDMYLITSPEYAMKKLLAGGFEKIFEISKSFRNREEKSSLHNPEFTLLEWYRAYAGYKEIMKDTEELIDFLAVENSGKHEIVYGDHKIDTTTPWLRKSVKELFNEYSGINEETMSDPEKLMEAVKEKGYKVDENTPYEDLFYHVFMNEIEPKLGLARPVIVFDYPAPMAALAKRKKEDTRYAERFETYIAGIELCNAFTELNDPTEQEDRLKEEQEKRKKLGKEQYGVDQSFISALKFGMPPSGGNALGVDRLMMLLTNTSDIRNIILFPLRDL